MIFLKLFVILHQFTKGDGFPVVDIHAGVQHGRRLGHQRPERMVGVVMDVSVDQYRTVTGHVPLDQRLVAKEQMQAVQVDFRHLLDGFELFQGLRVLLDPRMVMVAHHQMLVAGKIPEQRFQRITASVCKIAQHPDFVVFADRILPVLTDGHVVSDDVRKLCPGKADKVCVAEMGIGNEICLAHCYSSENTMCYMFSIAYQTF